MLARLRAALRSEPEPSLPVVRAGDRELWSLAVRAGEERGADEKLAYIVRTLGDRGRDVLVTPHAVQVRALGDPRRHSYFSSGAPYVLRELMRAMSVDVVEGPLVGLARGGLIWKRIGGIAADELVWILPAARSVEVRFRPAHGEPPPRAMRIPPHGSLSLPEGWSFRGTLVESDPPGTRCPFCGVRATRHRSAGDALVCAACGRSFDREQRD